ncbi:MAG: hypothetical protein ACT452_10610 [Microthrixaceae bacterium]
MTGFTAPTDDQVQAAVRRIPSLQLRRAFFEGLKNPLWIEPLAKEGAFSNPPEPEKTDEGYILDTYWPEIDYLIRVAPDAPEEVVDVLLSLRESQNAWVRRGVFEIGAAIPADQAARLEPLVRSWQSTGFGWRTDPRSLIAYAVNLLEGGQHQVGAWFADLIFKPSKSTRGRKPDLALEEYWYEQGLPAVTKALGPGRLELVLSWLVTYERKSGRLTARSDLSYFSRESIRQTTDSIYGVEDALVDAVRDLAIEAMIANAAAAKDVLLGSKMLLARMIALFSLSQALGRVGDGDKRIGQLLAAAGALLSDDENGDDACRIDYGELARAVVQTTGGPVAEVTQLIESGPQVDADRLRDWARDDSSNEGEIDERVRDYIDRWKHRWLSAVGAEALSARLQSELAELDVRFGVIEEPLAPTRRIQGWTGLNSPLSQDEMAAMSATELVAHLESWRHTGEGWGPEPSHEGQGRALTGLLTTNPAALKGVENLVDRLRPTYARAILHGWEAAFKAGLELEWAQVATLIQNVLGHDDESDVPAEGRKWDDDLNYRAAKQAAVSLLEELAQKRSSPEVPVDAMSQFAEMLIALTADDTAWTEYVSHGGGGGMDALTTSLNWQWPTGLRGLIHLMSYGKQTPWFEAARSALEAELERDDPRGAAWAVLGEGLGRLIDVDPEWVTPRAPKWFGSGGEQSASQQIALTTAMAVHYYHPTLYTLLSVPMITAIESTEPIVAGWDTHTDPLRRIGEWVIDAIIRGHKTIDDPVAHKFFAAAPAKVRGEAIGHVAWGFMHAEVVDDAIRDRFAELWDERVAHVRDHPADNEELSGFYWFVRSRKFSVEWWLPRLKEAAELNPSLSTERYMIGKDVAEASNTDPRGAFDVLKLLLEGRDEAGMVAYGLTRNAVPMVIARAITSDDEALKEDATVYMNRLGEKGYLSLDDEVRKVIEGEITQMDVDR